LRAKSRAGFLAVFSHRRSTMSSVAERKDFLQRAFKGSEQPGDLVGISAADWRVVEPAQARAQTVESEALGVESFSVHLGRERDELLFASGAELLTQLRPGFESHYNDRLYRV